ncbi:cell wall-binding repeat-containing protein [Rhodoglobus vestalii]|uniref:cell wall-binding repeat-containing protein n=1 Tax=Rhodoglobus vestalii TaxID=193384 RepID=UPI001476F0C7|nr:cell wall-binding repeat-containing protein [Rhodoglobus vestalii]
MRVQNYATAALYNYTPYRPNTAALNNLGSYGDSCSSYGNRNFWDYYYSWFGNPNDISPSGVAVDRIGGADRYAVSVGVSQSEFSSGVPVVYIATGQVFSDALSAGAAAAHDGGPLLLVRKGSIPAEVRAEIVRLAPAQIVVAVGPGSVSDTVYAELAGLTPEIRRESGIDRYEASRNIASGSFGGDGATIAYLATGKTFPDALSASAAAGSLGAPVILVNGTSGSIDAATAELLADLGVSDVRIAGGPASVSEGIKNSIAVLPGMASVARFGGADRYAVSQAVNSDAFSSATTAYVASATVFSDALSGGPVAGITSSPLYVVKSTCVPKSVLQDMIDLGVTRMVILGGPATLSSRVVSFTNCT